MTTIDTAYKAYGAVPKKLLDIIPNVEESTQKMLMRLYKRIPDLLGPYLFDIARVKSWRELLSTFIDLPSSFLANELKLPRSIPPSMNIYVNRIKNAYSPLAPPADVLLKIGDTSIHLASRLALAKFYELLPKIANFNKVIKNLLDQNNPKINKLLKYWIDTSKAPNKPVKITTPIKPRATPSARHQVLEAVASKPTVDLQAWTAPTAPNQSRQSHRLPSPKPPPLPMDVMPLITRLGAPNNSKQYATTYARTIASLMRVNKSMRAAIQSNAQKVKAEVIPIKYTLKLRELVRKKSLYYNVNTSEEYDKTIDERRALEKDILNHLKQPEQIILLREKNSNIDLLGELIQAKGIDVIQAYIAKLEQQENGLDLLRRISPDDPFRIEVWMKLHLYPPPKTYSSVGSEILHFLLNKSVQYNKEFFDIYCKLAAKYIDSWTLDPIVISRHFITPFSKVYGEQVRAGIPPESRITHAEYNTMKKRVYYWKIAKGCVCGLSDRAEKLESLDLKQQLSDLVSFIDSCVLADDIDDESKKKLLKLSVLVKTRYNKAIKLPKAQQTQDDKYFVEWYKDYYNELINQIQDLVA